MQFKYKEKKMRDVVEYLVTRDVQDSEQGNFGGTVKAGTVLYKCTMPTYGCVNETKGYALTRESNGGYPFFQFPKDAVMEVAAYTTVDKTYGSSDRFMWNDGDIEWEK